MIVNTCCQDETCDGTCGTQPFYWRTPDVDSFTKSYFRPGETVVERAREIADHTQKLLEGMFAKANPGVEVPEFIKTYADRLYDYVGRGWVSFSTPVWANFGREGLPCSCNNVAVEDSISSILSKVGEVGTQTKFGAGTSVYLGDLRGRGSPISDGGTADGAVTFLELFEGVTNIISQGPRRRGAIAGYLPVDHPDIREWLTIRQQHSRIHSAFSGVCISDDWMKAVRSGDKEKGEIWLEILRQRDETGQPYLWFTDTANRAAPQVYKDKGRTIKGSNLCVHEDTMILTDQGEKKIIDVLGQEVKVWTGQEWSKVTPEQTGSRLLLRRITLSTGAYLDCTNYHKWYVVDGEGEREVQATDLQVGDVLSTYSLPTGDPVVGATVVSSELLPGLHNVYCFNEPIRHRGVFNGILTGNCNEIALSSNDTESYVCVLSSVNLYHYEDWKDSDLPLVMMFLLDAVTEEYIAKTKGIPFMAQARNFAANQRAVGLGVLGLHSAYQRYNWPWSSKEAFDFNIEVHQLLDEKTLFATQLMAEWFGEPPMLKGYGQRNTTRMAIAPTKSSSFILGSISEGIQPIFSNVHTKDLAKGKFAYYNPELKRVLREDYDKDTPKVWEAIEEAAGSVQGLDWMSDHHKEVFKTFAEINQTDVVLQAADRQHYIDQGQSLNLCFPVNTRPKVISDCLMLGYDLGVKGFYYQLAPQNSAQLVVMEDCVACGV